MGTISQTGLLQAPASAANGEVTASAGGFDGSTSVTVKAPPTITSVTASPNPVTGTFTTLIVTATDDLGPAALTYT